jgi:hypothetical protein
VGVTQEVSGWRHTYQGATPCLLSGRGGAIMYATANDDGINITSGNHGHQTVFVEATYMVSGFTRWSLRQRSLARRPSA